MGVQGQINGWMIGRMDRQLAGWKRSQMDRGTGQMDRDRANGRTDLTFHRYAWRIGVSQNRRRLLDFDGRWGKLGLGKKIKDDPMGRGGVPPLSLVGAILSIF